MERNNLRFNPQKCERCLSDFGKKVLGVLMKQRDADREQKQQNNFRQFTQNKRILYFNDSSIRNTPIIPEPRSPRLQMYFDENTVNLNETDLFTPNVPPPEELTTTLQVQENIDNNEFIHPTVISSNILQLCNTGSEVKNHLTTNKTMNDIFEHSNKKETLDVNWENMFDTELLDDIINDIGKTQNNKNFREDNACRKNNTNNLEIALYKNDNDKSGKKHNTKIDANSKTLKKPKKKDNIKPGEPRKVTKTITGGSKNRKEKYTKTVKRWLSDVESYNAINENNDKENNNLANDTGHTTLDINKSESHNKMAIDKPKIVINKSVEGIKKVVQAQLANKDGVMKFAIPKKTDESDTVVPKDKKEKVTKKFIPPIKSQIPVKDITYHIITVDNSNVHECCAALTYAKQEIISVLIYSNGFCQLNSHFTDATCSADGILLGIGDMFYYFKGIDQKSRKIIECLLGNNKLLISYEARTVLIYMSSFLYLDTKTINMYDAKIGSRLLDPDNSPENFSDLQKLLSFTAPYTIATECTLQKAAWYMTLLRECWAQLKNLLVEKQLWQVFVQIEMKLLPIIAEMEHLGVSIDLTKLKSMEEMLLSRMKLVEQECYKAAGKVFQINSTLQVRNIIYDELQLDTKCNVKIRETLAGGVKSTSETMLRSLMSVHPLPKLILEYRHLHKAHATFLAGISQQVKDGVVKPTWVQTAAVTGRIASNNPNLQAIPKTPFSLVMFPDENDSETPLLNFRSIYVSRPGRTFVAADFKHVECRVFAHAAADTGLLRTLTHSDDLFRVLAAQCVPQAAHTYEIVGFKRIASNVLFTAAVTMLDTAALLRESDHFHRLNKTESSVSAAERERTKRLVYASLYGAGTRKLMEILEVSYEQALQVAASFNRTFPSLKSFGRHVVSQCSQNGGRLSTLCGRMRHFANITNEDFSLRSHAERQAVNFIIQGSAADLCKIAMILTDEQLRNTSPPVEARLILQIHDELVWEVEDQDVSIAAGIIKRVMESCGQHCGMSMVLPVAVTVGKNWGQMEDFDVSLP